MLIDTQRSKIQITSHIIPNIPTEEPQTKIKRKHGLKSMTKVRFNQRVFLREIPHLNDISEQQIETTWYTKKEYSDIRSELKLTVKLQRNGVLGLANCEVLCFRGLETRGQEGKSLRKAIQWNAVEAVLYEQARQNLLGTFSSDDVAKVYVDAVFRGYDAAHANGLSDAREACEACEGPSKEEIQEAKLKSYSQKSTSKDIMSRSELRRFLKSLNADFRKR
jgi:hypothetical protein